MDGKYIIIEGGDFAGKSTLVTNLEKRFPGSIATRHPGATPIGQHLRTLVKNPSVFGSDLILSPASAQLIMMIDQIEFINQLLRPSLRDGKMIIADRINFISGIVYGLAEGLMVEDVAKMLALIDTPKPDKVFILSPPWEAVLSRQAGRAHGTPDRFEDQGMDFIKRIHDIYRTLLSVNGAKQLISNFVDLDNIVYVEAALDQEELADFVASQI